MSLGAIFGAVIVALVMAVPTMLIMRWSKRRSERSELRPRAKEEERVALQAVERAADEKHLEELLRSTPLMQSTPHEPVAINTHQSKTDANDV